jgi:putative membrane protein
MSSLHPRPGARDAVVAALVVFLVWSGIAPRSHVTWLAEVFWVIGAIVMWAVWLRRLPCTGIAFTVLVVHSVVLIIGGIYTYAHVPLGAWVQEWMARPRNDYDRFGHFMQGFAPALLWREVFLRNAIVASRGWLPVIVVGMCLAFSAFFELLEFAVAMGFGDASSDFLGAQGDGWDAQWDMLFCFVGSIAALFLLAPLQDRQMRAQAQQYTDIAQTRDASRERRQPVIPIQPERR